MSNGYLSFVLHAHLPYVRHKEANRLEERWMYEAITETYIPLIWVLEEQAVTNPWTLSISPPVLEMLNDPVIQKRYLEHLELTMKLIKKEKSRNLDPPEKTIITFYEERYEKIMETYQKYDCNLIHAYKFFEQQKKLTCITSAATHAFLPYVQTEQAISVQIETAVLTFEKHFGKRPTGFWLPECAYSPGIDKQLADAGIRFTFVDEKTLLTSNPLPKKGIKAPVYSPHGVALFPRNQAVSELIWNAKSGYPGDFYYREFYRDIAYEREMDYIKGFIHPEGIRIDTGLKYWRITGETEKKDWYDRNIAEERLSDHAYDFTRRIGEHLHNHPESYPPHLVTTAFDAELFGHWWFEGPEFISKLNRISYEQGIEWITPQEFLHRHYQDLETVRPHFSTWGRNGYGEVWLNESNAWMYRHLHRCERILVEVSSKLDSNSDATKKRYADQMVREWMLAASSDWAFILDGNTAADYAKNRFQDHIERFNKLYHGLIQNKYHEEMIVAYENEYPFMQRELWPYFKNEHDEYINQLYSSDNQPKKMGKRILMLSWEFPPMIVGGLARHVFDLSRKLVSLGHEVYVITSAVDGYPDHEINQGVHVYRVNGKQPAFESFFHWTGSLNFAIVEQAIALSKKFSFDCIHAHDWLVSVSALALKDTLNVPLVSTIHATEHGRNKGITSPLQYEINQKEWELMEGSDQLIVCSEYMKLELTDVFSIPENKIHILPNGIDPEALNVAVDHVENTVCEQHYDAMVFSVGRMVKEKGFQTIIDAADLLKKKGRNVQFVIAGKGPMLTELREIINEKNLQNNVHLIGFVSDEERNGWFKRADAALFPSHYEPFGIVALESMAAGKLTIVSDTGGLREIVTHEETGLKIYPNNPESIVWAIEYMIANPGLCAQIANEGEKTARTIFSWETIAARTTHIYERVQKTKTNVIGGLLV